jgi:hypothetical protein
MNMRVLPLAFFATLLAAEDWTRFRGPNGSCMVAGGE